MDLTGHANLSATKKDQKVPDTNGFQGAHFVQPKDGDEHQVITIGELEVQLRVDKATSPFVHNSHQFLGNLSTADPNTRGGSRDGLQEKKDASNQADEKDDAQSEEPLGDQDDTKQKVAEGQVSRLAIFEKRHCTPIIQRPTGDSDFQLLTEEEEMADIVKKVLEKERVHNVSVKNSNEKEFVLDEHMFPSLANVHTQTNRRA